VTILRQKRIAGLRAQSCSMFNFEPLVLTNSRRMPANMAGMTCGLLPGKDGASEEGVSGEQRRAVARAPVVMRPAKD
jgi:hypothetical protein